MPPSALEHLSVPATRVAKQPQTLAFDTGGRFPIREVALVLEPNRVLFEVVPDDRNDMRFKLMVAHLYTAGVKVKALAEAFAVDPKTMNHWGRALRSGDPKRLAEALAGREGRRKLTAEVEAFVRFRFKVVTRLAA